MPSSKHLLALAAAASSVSAYQGFNYGARFSDGSAKNQQDFESAFETAANLQGTDGGFTSARLFTMIQEGAQNDPISAIPAAIKTKTSLLLGLWASAGNDAFNNEITALEKTIDQYCGQLGDLVAGISVGSEDLYRNSPIGIENDEYAGENPEVLADYISRVRDTIRGSCLSDVPIGHVDTWTAYANASNNPLIEACDFIGMDAYPYFENTRANSIDNAAQLFQNALDATRAGVGDREIWITETGWPVSGDESNEATPGRQNAEKYYKAVGCPRFGKVNIWWYQLQDAAPTAPNPSFGLVGSELSRTPLYDLSCDDVEEDTSSSSSSSAEPETSTTAEEPSSTAEETEAETTTEGGDATEEPVTSPTFSDIVIEEPTNSVSEAPATTTVVEEPDNTTAPADDSSDSSDVPSTETGAGQTPGGEPSQSGDEPSPTGDESGDGGDDSPPQAAGSQLNSFSAAVVAMVIAVGML